MNATRLTVCVLLTCAALLSGCHTPGGGALRCKCFDHLPRNRKWIYHKYFDPHRYDYHATCWSPMMYDPCTCCWAPGGIPDDVIYEQAPQGEVIDSPEPAPPTLDPTVPPIIPDSVPELPSLEPPMPEPNGEVPEPGVPDGEIPGGVVPDLGTTPAEQAPIIRPAAYQAPPAWNHETDGAPILKRIPSLD
mgnify:CR=1 FL=1